MRVWLYTAWRILLGALLHPNTTTIVCPPKENTVRNEPAVTIASITAAVAAVLALIAAFGVDLTDAQTSAILGVVAVVAPLVVGFVTRSKVTPVNKEL